MTYTPLPFDAQDAANLLSDAANGADDGDIYVQRSRSEGFVFDDGRLKSATYNIAPLSLQLLEALPNEY